MSNPPRISHRFRALLSRVIVAVLASALLGATWPAAARAALVGTEATIETRTPVAHADTAAERRALRSLLVSWGLEPAEAATRVAALSDAQLAAAAPGGQSAHAGGGIVGVAVFVLAVLIVTDVLGYTNIFPFIHSSR